MSTIIDEQYTTLGNIAADTRAQGDTTGAGEMIRRIGVKEGNKENLFKNAQAILAIDLQSKKMNVDYNVFAKGWFQENIMKPGFADNPDTWIQKFQNDSAIFKDNLYSNQNFLPAAVLKGKALINLAEGDTILNLQEEAYTANKKNFRITSDTKREQAKDSIKLADSPTEIQGIFDSQILSDDDNVNKVFYSASELSQIKDDFYNYANSEYMFKLAAVYDDNGELDYRKTEENIKNPNFTIKTVDGKRVDVQDAARLELIESLGTLASNQDKAKDSIISAANDKGTARYYEGVYEMKTATTKEDYDAGLAKVNEGLNQVSSETKVELLAHKDSFLKSGDETYQNTTYLNLKLLASGGFLDTSTISRAVQEGKLDPGKVNELVDDNRIAKEKIESGNARHESNAITILANTLGMNTEGVATGNVLLDIAALNASNDNKKNADFARAYSYLQQYIEIGTKEYGLTRREILTNHRVIESIGNQTKDKPSNVVFGDTNEEIQSLLDDNKYLSSKTVGIGPITPRGIIINQIQNIQGGNVPQKRLTGETIAEFDNRVTNLKKVLQVLRYQKRADASNADVKMFAEILEIPDYYFNNDGTLNEDLIKGMNQED